MADVRDNKSQVQGTRPHDEAESGSVADRPVKIGGKASTALPTAVSNADRVDAYFDEYGRQVVKAEGVASATAVGQDLYFDSDGDNTAQTIKSSSGRLYFLEVSNPNSADAYLQLYDTAAAITVGTTVPNLSFLVPAGDGTRDGAMDKFFEPPLAFANSIKYACTLTATGSGDPTTGLIVNAGFK